jgi:glycine oxidase
MLAPGTEIEGGTDPCFLELSRESCRLWPEFAAELERDSGRSCRYRTEGTLLVALSRDHQEELEHAVALQRRLGVEAEWLSAAEARSREPHLTPRVTAGLFLASDRQVDPRALVASLEAAIARRGGRILIGTVSARRPGLVEVRGDGADLLVESPALVLAAGSWSNQALPGFPALPLRPVKGQILRLRGDVLIRHVVRTPEVYLVPRSDGELVVGATVEEQGFDSSPRAGAVLELLREAWRVLPEVAELAFQAVDVGFRPALRDHLPAIGPAGEPGLYVATGHFRNGVMLAPVTARLLVEAIVSGRVPDALRPFSPSRFLEVASDPAPRQRQAH